MNKQNSFSKKLYNLSTSCGPVDCIKNNTIKLKIEIQVFLQSYSLKKN